MAKHRPVTSHTFTGMASAVAHQAEAAGEKQAEELSAKLLEPLGNINHLAGSMENDSPLFFGKVNPTLFGG
jgi:hypothetical protein